MGLIYTGEELIKSIRRKGVVPRTGSPGVLDWDLLELISEVIWEKFVPKLMKLREGFFVAKTRLPLLAGVTEYRLPARAALQKVKSVNLWDGQNRYPPLQADVEGNYLVVSEQDSRSGHQLEVAYFFRPSAITLAANCRQVTEINGSVVTLSASAPASWGALVEVDVHSEHSGAECKIWDSTVTVNSDHITFTDAIDGTTFGTRALEEGDWVCEAGWAALPGLPHEMHPSIAAATALQWAISNGDDGLVKRLQTDLDPTLRDLFGAADVRVEAPRRLPLPHFFW